MLKTNVTKNRDKKLIRNLIIIVILSIAFIFFKANNVMATNNGLNANSAMKNGIDSTININNEEEVSNTIKDLILTINSEGMNKTLLSQTLNFYSQLTENYSNNEIASMIEYNKSEFQKNEVQMENIDTIISVLRNIDTEQLNKVLSKVNIDEVAMRIEKGEDIQLILKDIMSDMSTAEKVNLVMDILLSAYMVKTILVILIALFIYRTLLRCVIYKKAKKKAWAPFIPIYRNVVMLKICGMSPWWLLLLLVPVIGWILLLIVSVASKFMLAEAFGKGTGFAFGLWLLGPIFETIIVFSRKTKYIGFEEE